MEKIESGGETYYKITEIYNFISTCTKNNNLIYSIEFFKIVDEKIVPYVDLLSIDSVMLFSENNEPQKNLYLCNQFIKNCVKKSRLDKVAPDLYFTCVLEQV